jgi:hypothetical protein
MNVNFATAKRMLRTGEPAALYGRQQARMIGGGRKEDVKRVLTARR